MRKLRSGIDERTSPIGLAHYALEFFEAASAVDDQIGIRDGYELVPPVTVLYLTGHSIELSLKAFLLHKGTPIRELRSKKLGHDLHACLRKAKELGLHEVVLINDTDVEVINILNEQYSNKRLEYFFRGYARYPSYGLLEQAAVRLFNGIAPCVGYPKSISGYINA